ncbi:MAG TPA: hypothetical protein VK538_08390 [Solirubrobacteraceae bacterium]|jgi:hypothetical protein|nr:hypothetical protein [Solirubrobacteraceae bacterium]
MLFVHTFALQTVDLYDAPKLRLLAAGDRASSAASPSDGRAGTAGRPALHLVKEAAAEAHPVLVAGADSAGRASVLHELAGTMAPNTTFTEAEAFWEVLVRAPSSSMVIISGELDELRPESLMQMLAHRHPGLPVVSIDAPTRGEQRPQI